MTEAEARKAVVHFGTEVTRFSSLVSDEGGTVFLTDAGRRLSEDLQRYKRDVYYEAAYKLKKTRVTISVKDLFDMMGSMGARAGSASKRDGPIDRLEHGCILEFVRSGDEPESYGIVDNAGSDSLVWLIKQSPDGSPQWYALTDAQYRPDMASPVSQLRAMELRAVWWEMHLKHVFGASDPFEFYQPKNSELHGTELVDQFRKFIHSLKASTRYANAKPSDPVKLGDVLAGEAKPKFPVATKVATKSCAPF
jgi:hypothetical protein